MLTCVGNACEPMGTIAIGKQPWVHSGHTNLSVQLLLSLVHILMQASPIQELLRIIVPILFKQEHIVTPRLLQPP